MRFVQLSPKFIYFSGIIVNFLILGLFAFLLNMAVESGHYDTIFLMIVLSSLFSIRLFFYVTKHIYAKIDTVSNVMIFGNIFVQNEVSMSNVRLIKKSKFMISMYKIRVNDSEYWMHCPTVKVDDYIQR